MFKNVKLTDEEIVRGIGVNFRPRELISRMYEKRNINSVLHAMDITRVFTLNGYLSSTEINLK